MEEDFASDEEKYANESFENDTDTDLEENSDTASENENEHDFDPDSEERNIVYAYTRDNFNAHLNDYVPYTSSSEDDEVIHNGKAITEVDIEKTIIENDTISQTRVVSNNVECISEHQAVDVTSEESGSESEVQPQDVLDTEQQPESKLVLQSDSERNVETETVTEAEIETFAEQAKSSDLDPVYVFDSKDINFEPPLSGDKSARVGSTQYKLRDNCLAENCILFPDGTKHWKQSSPRSDCDTEETDTPRTETQLDLPDDPLIEFCISSRTPSSFSAEDYAFHMDFLQKPVTNSRIKNARRKSWSFTNERMREIDRQNQILLKKILSQKGSYSLNQKKSNVNLQNVSVTTSKSTTRQATAAVNRKKQQRQIDLDNQVLKRKIEAISYRRPPPL